MPLGLGWLGNALRQAPGMMKKGIGALAQGGTMDADAPSRSPMVNFGNAAGTLPNPAAPASGIGPVASPINPAAEIPMPPRVEPPPMRRQDVPIPQLPGYRGEPRPYDRMTASEYDYVQGRPNSYDADPNMEGRQKMGIGGRLKSGLKPALIGFLQGMGQADTARGESALARGLGGAAGGFGVGVGDPTSARVWEHQQLYQPGIEAEMKREQDAMERARKNRIGDLEITGKEAEIKGIDARTQATIAGTKDAELVRKLQEAQIAKMQAETQAKLTGVPKKFMEYDPETGVVYESFMYPDGRIERGGQSGTAQLRREGFETREGIADRQIKSREGIVDKQIGSREKIVGIQQRGATGRTAMTQSGQDRRQKERLAAGETPPAVGTVPYGPPVDAPLGGGKRQWLINEAMKRFGMTQAQAEAEADKRGIK